MKKLSAFSGNRRGQSLVETAIILPILLIILVGIVELGFALANQMTVTTAGREGARFGTRFGATNDSVANDAILGVVHETSSRLFSLDETQADVFVVRAKTDDTGHIDASADDFGAASYWVPETLQDSPNIDGTLVEPARIEADLQNEPDLAVIVVQVFYDHRSVLGLPLVANLSDQIPISTYTVMRIEPSQARANCCLYPLALKLERVETLTTTNVFAGWIKDDILLGNFGWTRWDPASGASSADDLVDRLQHPCMNEEGGEQYTNPDDPDDHALNPGDQVMGATGAMNKATVKAELDILCGATTDSDYQSNKGNEYCVYGLIGPDEFGPNPDYDGLGAQLIPVPVYDTVEDPGSNFKYHVATFAFIKILHYYLPSGGDPRLTIEFDHLDDEWCQE
jgi:hypothetical protein